MTASQTEDRVRVAVVTGGESGIGRATALRLTRAGYRVYAGDLLLRDENRSLFESLQIQSRHCDVRREADIQDLIAAAADQHERLDVLVNNAGVGMVKPITEVTEAEWDRCLDTNLKAAFFGCKHAIPFMLRSGGGAIVNVSSNAGLLPRAHDPVYSISKHALIGLTKSLALCHAGDRIRINAVCPGPVGDTGMMNADLDKAADREVTARQFIAASPLARAWQRMITPDEVAQAIEYLVSDAAAMVTGTSIAIDGGKSLGVPPNPKSVPDA
ncbi:MAG: SDR family oxidoreductase [Planctomycetaceae bacterium]|nr:SDR family oxidoreductase [Planctomycetaceae bacterium]